VVPASSHAGAALASTSAAGDGKFSFDVFFRLPKNASATALSQQLPFRLILGSRRFERQNRRRASQPNWVSVGVGRSNVPARKTIQPAGRSVAHSQDSVAKSTLPMTRRSSRLALCDVNGGAISSRDDDDASKPRGLREARRDGCSRDGLRAAASRLVARVSRRTNGIRSRRLRICVD
jgi:hypothetical protein